MATNNFKPFATGNGANVTSQADYEALAALTSGFSSGKASSAQINKALRQSTFIASALAQYVANKSGSDVLDDGDIAGFVSKMTSGFGAQYLSRSNPFSDIGSDGESAITVALANLSVFNKKSFAANDFVRIPDIPGGLIIQWAKIKSGSAGTYTWTYPTAFPSARLSVWGVVHRTNVSGTDSATIAFDDQNDPAPLTLSNFNLRVNGSAGANAAFVLALGY